jgi:hypothetical protein
VAIGTVAAVSLRCGTDSYLEFARKENARGSDTLGRPATNSRPMYQLTRGGARRSGRDLVPYESSPAREAVAAEISATRDSAYI